jgi:hypothetical protein
MREKEENFQRRWLIFVSILAQKFLQFVAKPLAGVGLVIEMWLNLLSSNRNFGVLLLNLIRGQCPPPSLLNCLAVRLILKEKTLVCHGAIHQKVARARKG